MSQQEKIAYICKENATLLEELISKYAKPATDADMLAMGYTAYDIECIREWSPAYNTKSELDAKRAAMANRPEVAVQPAAWYYAAVIVVATILGTAVAVAVVSLMP